jgi:hypothetical protein
MNKYREYVGWGAIILAALNFLPIPLPSLPPMLTAGALMMVPGLGKILLMLYPMLLFAAGIGIVKGWDGGKKLFGVWSMFAIPAAIASFQFNYVFAAVDLAVIVGCLVIIFWNDLRKRQWSRR